MYDIGIVGAGISGLHLALRLQQLGVRTTLYAERTPEELAASRPLNMVARFAPTRARERELGVAHWNDPAYGMFGAKVSVLANAPMEFYGRLEPPGESVDFRVYLPRLMADYAERGGVLEYLAPDAESIIRRSARHDLVVVASGRRSVAELFPRDPVRSLFDTPQRMITAGFYHGIAPMPERAMQYQFCPGVGEIFGWRFLHLDGLVHGITIEAIPGGPFSYLAELSYDDDPAGFIRNVLKTFAEYAPGLRERIDEREFHLARPNDVLRGGITPTVRTGWAALPDNKYAVAIGDAWLLNDPIAGQGANTGSHSAFVLAEEIMAGPPFDESFCRAAQARLWELARPATEWSNSYLLPPSKHRGELLAAACADVRVADAYITNINDPAAMWDVLSTPERAAAWLLSVRQQ